MKKKKTLQKLFKDSETERWQEEWQDMPEFIQNKAKPFKCIKVYFDNKKDIAKFSQETKQTVTEKTKFIWYPKLIKGNQEIGMDINKRYVDES